MALGIGRVPEDRIGTGLLTQSPLADSMALPRIGRPPFSHAGILDLGAIRGFAAAQIEKFAIRTPGPLARTGMLSGGNLQKALLARELAWDPLVVLAAQPTRGLDVGASQFVHEQFMALRSHGRAVIVISEDLEELFQLSLPNGAYHAFDVTRDGTRFLVNTLVVNPADRGLSVRLRHGSEDVTPQ